MTVRTGPAHAPQRVTGSDREPSPKAADHGHPERAPSADAKLLYRRLLFEDFAFFMSELNDPAGRRLVLAPHLERWCRLIADEPRLVLLAPRDHGKSTLGLAYILWRAYRHGRDPATGDLGPGPPGTYSAVLMSATRDQAAVHLATFRDLLAANDWLFPSAAARKQGGRPAQSSSRHVRLANGAEVRIRAFRTSTRGLHPHLLLLDDVLSDENTGNQRQREKTWRHFVGTLLPMHPAQVIILGTSVHHDDLLHRLRPGKRLDPATPGAIFGFRWVRYRAIDPETETSLWPARHPYLSLAELRALEPTIFSREYQNDPRDDAASIFPHELTQGALDAGAELTFVPGYRKEATEVVVLGADLAASEAAGADFTVVMVAAVDVATGRRRVLSASRHKGLTFADQVDLLTDLRRRYRVDLGIVEQNSFQRWVVDELRRRPAPGLIVGHTTGQEKTSPADGVTIVKLALLADLWVMPSADAESLRFAKSWQAELSAFGWKDGRLEGLGEHDDTVIATWFVELAIRFIANALNRPADEFVTMEQLGIRRVRIGDYE